MKKFLVKILLFFLCVAVLDCLFGIAMQYMNDRPKGGGSKSRYYVCKESYEDVLIFGSSRAKHHYVPDVIEDTLGMTCYNAGEDGNGIILSYGFLKMISTRYLPKLIIYDVTGFDMYEDDNFKYLDILKPFYYEPGIDSLFWKVEPKTRVMMLSNLYRYNTTCLRVIGNFVHPMVNYPKGYSALHRTMEYEPEITFKKAGTVDSVKLGFFEKFLKCANERGISMVCCVSPSYKPQIDTAYYAPVKELCDRYNIVFLDDMSDSEISSNKEYFQDSRHLNDTGARLFTSKLAKFIKSLHNS